MNRMIHTPENVIMKHVTLDTKIKKQKAYLRITTSTK